MTSVEKLYGEYWAGDESALDAELDGSLDPRGTDWLFTFFAELGPQAGQLVVDAGARDASGAIRLVRDHSLRAIALDPVGVNVERARAAAEGLDVEVIQAAIEQMPIEDGSADWIWCRDVLVHVDAERGFAECARILRPGGQMLAYVTCATQSLEPREGAELFDALAIVRDSTDPGTLERHASEAGLTLVSKIELGGEWRERMIEEETWDPGADLLRLSRLRRKEQFRAADDRVAAYVAGRRWGIYQLLGKLCPTVYLWQKSA
jgi:SAM-dependent methyltransferase